jgi:cell division protein FtsB
MSDESMLGAHLNWQIDKLEQEKRELRELNAELKAENNRLKQRVKELENYIRGLRIVGS